MPKERKKIIKFLDEYKTGIREIDFQHTLMVDIINDMYYHSINGKIPDFKFTLELLLENSEANFKTEEFLMRKESYERYGIHKKEHEELNEQLKDYLDKIEKISIEELFNFINEKLFRHLEEEDLLLNKYIKKNEIKRVV